MLDLSLPNPIALNVVSKTTNLTQLVGSGYLSGTQNLTHPVGVTFYQDKLYFTDTDLKVRFLGMLLYSQHSTTNLNAIVLLYIQN